MRTVLGVVPDAARICPGHRFCLGCPGCPGQKVLHVKHFGQDIQDTPFVLAAPRNSPILLGHQLGRCHDQELNE